MSTSWRRRVLALGVAMVVALAGWLGWVALRPSHPAFQGGVEGWARAAADGVPELEVTSAEGEYVPNVIHALAGRPLRLRVTVRDAHGCGTRLLVPDLGVDAALPPAGQALVVELPSAGRGSFLFTCGARMVKGVLLFE